MKIRRNKNGWWIGILKEMSSDELVPFIFGKCFLCGTSCGQLCQGRDKITSKRYDFETMKIYYNYFDKTFETSCSYTTLIFVKDWGREREIYLSQFSLITSINFCALLFFKFNDKFNNELQKVILLGSSSNNNVLVYIISISKHQFWQ